MTKKMTVVLAGTLATVTLANTVAPDLEVNSEKNSVVLQADSNLPINIRIGSPQIVKTGNVWSGNYDGYVPTSRVASQNNNVTNGVNVAYSIPISIHSTNGKLFNIPDVEVTANPVITYNGPQTPEKEKVAQEIAKQIKVQVEKQSNLNSSYSGKLTVGINIGPVDWDMTIQPNIEVKCGNVVQKVDTEPLKATTQYKENIYGEVSQPDADGYINVQMYGQPETKNDFINNVTNKKIKSITFKASISGQNGKLILNPVYANNSDIKYNPTTGECTVTGKYAGTGSSTSWMDKLFKIEATTSGTNKNELTNVTVNIQPQSAIFEGGNGTNGLVSFSNWGHSINYEKAHPVNPLYKGLVAPIVQNTSATPSNGTVQIKSSSTVNRNIYNTANGYSGDWKIYGGSYLPNGRMILPENGNCLGAVKNAKYVSLSSKALNIMNNGTPKEKYDLLKNLELGTPIEGSIIYNGSDLADGKVKPGSNQLNLVLYPLGKNSDGDASGNISYDAIPNAGSDYNVLGKTFTLGLLTDSKNPSDKGGNASTMLGLTDQGYTNVTPTTSNIGSIDGFMTGNNNTITPTSINGTSQIGFNNGNGYSTVARMGEISHDSASVKKGQQSWVNVAIDYQKYGDENSDWLNNGHDVVSYVNTPSFGRTGSFEKGTDYIYDMGTPDFTLTGPIQIGGKYVSLKDVKIEGSKVIIPTIPNMPTNSNVIIPVKFNNPLATSVNVNLVGIKGPSSSNPTGIEYNINGAKIPLESLIPGTEVNGSSSSRSIAFKTQNGCIHYSNGIQSDNTSTMTALVQNVSKQTKQYLTIIQLPKADNNSLPANQGQPSQGGLSATLQTINNEDCPIYVLPKSAVNDAATPGGIKTNEQQINSTNPFNMAGMKANIESGKTGWVRYTPGMDLSNIVSIAAMPTIKGNSIWKLNYNVKLDGVKNGTYQYTTSEFKYYDVTDGVGSISNVVTLAPKGENLNQMWNSSAVVLENGSTRVLTKEELAKTVTFTNSITGQKQTEPLSYIFSHGNLIDANYDITPATPDNHLQQNIDLVNSAASLAQAGFKLVKTTVKVGNGGAAEVNKDFFTNTGVMSNTQFTKVVFTLEPIAPKVNDTVTVQVKNADGTYSNVVVNGPGYQAANGTNPGTQPQIGTQGEPNKGASDVKIPTIPDGYKIDEVIVETQNADGSWTSKIEPATFVVPATLGSANTHYIYQISKIPVQLVHDTVSVTVDGKTVPSTEPGYVAPQIGKDGIPVTGDSGVTTPKIPDGYQITRVTVVTHNPDGTTTKTQESANYKVPGKLGKINTDYIYNITKKVQDTLTVKVKQKDGTYKEISVGQPGYVVPQTGTAGIPNEGESGIKNPTIPNGYKIDSISLNGKIIASTSEEIKTITSSIPNKLGSEDANYVYNISPLTGSVTTQVVVEGTDGTAIPNDPATQAQEIVQGKDGNTSVGTAIDAKTANTIIIGTTTIDLASLDASTQLQKLGYKLIKTTIQTPTDKLPMQTTPENAVKGNVVEGEIHIVYTLQKLSVYGGVTVQVKNLTTGKDEVVEHEVQRAKVGTKFSDAVNYTAPKGYSIVKTTLNGTDITQSDLVNKTITEDTLNPYVSDASITTEEMNGDEHVVYTIVKNVKDTVKVLVDGKPMTTEVANDSSNPKSMEDQNGPEGTPAIEGATPGDSGVTTPVIPTGYKITEITLNGKPILEANDKPVTDLANYKVPEKLAKEDQNFVYNITKIVPVTVKVVTADGTPITTTTTNNVKVGSKDFTNVQNGISTDKIINIDTGINVPKGYHISKLTVNGKNIEPANNIWNVPVNSVIGANGTEVVYTLTKDAPKTWKTTVTVTTTDGGEVPGVTIPSIIITTDGGTVIGTSTTVKIPKGYKIVKVTEGTSTTNGTPVISTTSVNGGVTTAYTPDIIKVHSDHYIHYIVEKIGSLSVQVIVDGDAKDKNNIAAHDVETGVAVGTDLSGYKITVPKGYKLVKTTIQAPTDAKPTEVTDVTVNKDRVTSSLDIANKDIVQGTTKIVYHLVRLTGDVTTTVVGPNGKTFKTNPPIHVEGNDGDLITSDKTTITPPPHYHVVTVEVNGKKIIPKDNGNGTYSVPPMDYNDGHQTVVYHVAPDEGNVDVTVKEIGTNALVIPTAQTVKDQDVIDNNDNLVKLSGYELTDADKAKLKADGYELIPANTTVQVNTDAIHKTTQEALAGMNLFEGTTHITYYVQQIGTVSVKVMLKDGDKVTLYKDKGIVDSDKVGNSIKDYGYTIPAGYHLVSTTVQTPLDKTANSTTQEELGKMNIIKGNTEIVYTIEKDAPKIGTVDVTVNEVDANGKVINVLQKAKHVQTANAGVAIAGANYSNIDPSIVKGYHLVSSSADGVATDVTITKDGIVTGNVGDGAEHIIYNVVKDAPKVGNVTVEVLLKDGDKTSVFHETKTVQNGDVNIPFNGSANYGKQEIPAGYHLVKTTVNGTEKTLDGKPVIGISGNIVEGTTAVVYIIEKDAPKTGAVDVTVNIVDAKDTTKVLSTPILNKQVQSAVEGTAISGADYNNVKTPELNGYHIVSATVNGAGTDLKLGKDLNSVTGKVGDGVTHVVYNIVKDAPTVVKGKVTVIVVGTDGHVYVPKHDVTGNGGDIVGGDVPTAGSTTITPPIGTNITTVTVDNTPYTPVENSNGSYSIPPIKVKLGTQNIVWTVTPAVGNVKVTVNEVDENGTITKVLLNNKEVQSANVGATISGANYDNIKSIVPAGYHLVSSSIKTPETGSATLDNNGVVSGQVVAGTTEVIYNITKEAPKPPVKSGSVKVTIVTTDGEVLVKNHTVATDKSGTKVTKGIGYTNIPGYTLTNTSIDGTNKGAISVNEVILTDGTTQIVYTVEKNPTPPVKPEVQKGSVKVTVVTTDGKIIVPNHTVSTGNVGTEVATGLGYNNVDGYHLVKTTVDGTDKGAVSIGQVTFGSGTTQIIYTIEKDKTPTTPVNPPVQKTGKVTVTVVDNNGNVVVKTHTVSEGVVGSNVTGTGYTPNDGYEITKITVAGKEVSQVPSMKISDGTTSIVYVINKKLETPSKPDIKPEIKYGNVTVQVVTNTGEIVVAEHEVAKGVEGTNISSMVTSYEVPQGYHLVKEMVGGTVVSTNANITLTNGTTKVVYVIAKNSGTPLKPESPSTSHNNGNTVVIPNTNNDENTGVITNNTHNNGNVEVTPSTTNNNNNITVIKELPKTGIANEANNVAKGLGFILGVSSLLGFILRRKK